MDILSAVLFGISGGLLLGLSNTAFRGPTLGRRMGTAFLITAALSLIAYFEAPHFITAQEAVKVQEACSVMTFLGLLLGLGNLVGDPR